MALARGLKAYGELSGNKRAQIDHRGRRPVLRRHHALGLHPRARVPGPDQGEARDHRSFAHRRKRAARPFRPLADRPSAPGRQAAGMGRRPRRGPPAPAPGARGQPQDRGPQAPPARQTRRLLTEPGGRLGDLHRRGRLGRRFGQTGPQPQDPGGVAAPGQDPQCRVGRQYQGRSKPADRRHHSGAGLRHRAASTATATCATRRSSS